jgi:ABC-2 type transport system permease protein
MSPRKTLATSGRVLNQLRHDPRTLMLLFVIPSILITILRYVYQGNTATFDHIAPMLLGIFPMVMMFLITSVVTLRERTTGTLDRLMTMPIHKLDFIVGYAIAFSALGFLQAGVAATVMLGLLHVTVLGGAVATVVGAVFAALLGTSLGLFTSAFARSEFQAVQFMPAFIFPQLLTCGLFIARSEMAKPLQWFADVVPLTYSVDALKQVTTHATWTGSLSRDLIVVGAFALAALMLGSATIRRQE